MAFEPGKPRPENAGRKPGTPNKKNQEIYDLAQELDCSPVKILMLFTKGDYEALGYPEYDEKTTKDGDTILVRTITPELRKSAASDLMPYMYGKRKPVDSNGDDSTDIFSALLEAVDGNK